MRWFLKARFGWISVIVMQFAAFQGAYMIQSPRGPWFDGSKGYPLKWHTWKDFGHNPSHYDWLALAADLAIWLSVVVCVGLLAEQLVRWCSQRLCKQDDHRGA
jgi:hypothetical protein